MNRATSRSCATSRRARPSTWRRRFTENCHKLGLVIHGDFIVGLPGETRETLRNTIDFAKRLDVETIQVSIAHAFPGTEFYDYAKKNNLVQHQHGGRRQGHQLPNVVYPGILEKDELVDWVERFYGEYYFRPKAAWRIVRKAIFDNHERKRLYKEAKSYLSLRHKRKKYVAEQKAERVLEQERRKLDEARRSKPVLRPNRTHSRTLVFGGRRESSPIIVILSNALGNFALARGMRGTRITVKPLRLYRGHFHARG